MNKRSASFYLALNVAFALAACRSKPPEQKTPLPPPVCSTPLPRQLVHTRPDALPASIWYHLLIKSYDGSVNADAIDCSGEPISWAELPENCADADFGAKLARRGPVRDDELIIRNAGGDYWFAWAPLWRLDNGMAQGPLAIAYVQDGRLEARAIGTLRGYTERARIEVRRLGNDFVLTAEGEHCTGPGQCTRAARLAYLDRQRFRTRPLRAASVRSCLAPAWFPLNERVSRRLNPRWERVLSRTLAIGYEADAIVVDERIAVHDRDLQQASLPPRLFREAQSRMRIVVRQGEFMTEGHSLWKSIRLEDASLDERGTAEAR